jgi:protein phosphatase
MTTALADPQTTPPEPLHPTDHAPLAVRGFGATDRGRVRPRNEDQFLIARMLKSLCVQQSSLPQPETRWGDECGHLFIVADGMGGHRAGEQASALAVQTLGDFVLNACKWFFHLHDPEGQNVLREFQEALRWTDRRVWEESMRRPELFGMGTTLTIAYAIGGDLFVAHAGDSRCYLMRGDDLMQLTHDHTLAEELVRNGGLTPEEAVGHRLRHVITNAVGGTEQGVRAELHKLELDPGDVLLLCSDGVTGELSDDRIKAILREAHEPETACKWLLAEAREHGGRDNITAVVARFDAAD